MSVTIDKFEYATDLAAQAAWVATGESVAPYTINNFVVDTAAGVNYRNLIPAAKISKSGTIIRIKITGYNTHEVTFNGVSIGERSGTSDDFAATPTRVTFNRGDSSVTVPAGATIYSDAIFFALDESKDYFIHLHDVPYSGTVYQGRSASGSGLYYNISETDDSMTQSVSYSWLAKYTYFVADIEIAELYCYSESTIKEEGDYSMKVVAPQTTSLNETLIRTCSPTLNFTDQAEIKFKIRSSRTGTNLKIGFHDSGGTTTESNIAISSADTWEEKTIDISSVTNANKDAIDSIVLTVTNADAENTIYLDYMRADDMYDEKYSSYNRNSFLPMRGRSRDLPTGLIIQNS